MFDDAFGMATLCVEKFRDGVRDSFGASIITDALDPILKEIDALRVFNEEFQQRALNIDQVLKEVKSIQFNSGGAR